MDASPPVGQAGGMAWMVAVPWFDDAPRRRRWLVGVSGGADSVALLHLLVDAGFRDLVVCHLDHRLRGRASTEDAKFVRRLAERLGQRVEMARADVRALAEASGESVETAARRARHDFFATCAARHRCPRVLLAHHADDQAETLLWNLVRGSHGPKAMKESQRLVTGVGVALEIVRPLLALRRTELRDWLAARNLRWREDATNAEAVAVRNRLRHEVLPLLAEIAGRDVVPALVRGAAAAEEIGEIVDWAVERAAALDPQGRLHLPVLRSLPPALRGAVVADFLKRAGVPRLDRALVERVAGLLDPQAGPAVNLPGGGSIRRRAGRLVLER